MFQRRSLQSLHSPQSLQVLLMRLCSQMPAPPQSLHWLMMRFCWRMLGPPQSLHLLLMRPCSQMPAPLQSLHPLLWRLYLLFLRPFRGCGALTRCLMGRRCMGAAEGGRAADGLAAHGAGKGAVEQRGAVCVFYYCRTYYKAVRVGGVEDMCYETRRRRAEACVDESAHHALVNAGGREIV